jgi:ribosomal protein L27
VWAFTVEHVLYLSQRGRRAGRVEEKALPAGNRGARIRGLNIHPGAMAIGFDLLVFALSDAAVMLVG